MDWRMMHDDAIMGQYGVTTKAITWYPKAKITLLFHDSNNKIEIPRGGLHIAQ